MSRKRRRKQEEADCRPTPAPAVPASTTSKASQACTASSASKATKGAMASGAGLATESGAFANPILAMGPLKKSFVALLLSLFAAFGPLCTDMYLPSLPDIAQELDITTTFAQASITSCLLGFALGQLFIGPLSDGWGRRGLLLFSLAVFTASSLLCSYAVDGWTFLALRFFMGVGGAGGAVLSRAISCDTYQGPDLTRFMSLLMAIHSVGPVLGPIVGGMVAGQAGWRAVFHLLAAIGVFLFVCTLPAVPDTLDPARRVPGGVGASLRNMSRLFGHKAFLCYAGVQGFTMAGFFTYISASPFVCQKIYGFSVGEYSLIFASNAIGVSLFALAAGLLSRRFGDRRILAVGDALHTLAAFALLACAMVLPASPWPMLASLFALVSTQGLTMTASFTLGISSQTVGAGAASGILGVAVFLFGCLSSPLAGLAGPMSAMPLGIVCAISSLCSLACTFRGNRLFESSPARASAEAMLGKAGRR